MNEIVKSQNVINSMEDVERAAKAMSASGFFPDSKEFAKAIVKVLAGRELGFGAFASMTGVAVIQGKPVIGANLLAAAVKQTGKYNYRVKQHTNDVCEIIFLENNKEVGISKFTMEDAKGAGLTSKDNWKKYPRNMLFARAISNGQKWFAPDVFNGVTVYTPDEIGAVVDDEGNIVEVVAQDVTPKKTIRERYTELFNEALEVSVENISQWQTTDNMTDNEIIELGRLLRMEVEKAKANVK